MMTLRSATVCLGLVSCQGGDAALHSTEAPALSEVFRSSDLDQLERWSARTDLDPQVRYASLRRLEEIDASRAVGAAVPLLQEANRLVRENALALLVRSDGPLAAGALAELNGSDRELAAALRSQTDVR